MVDTAESQGLTVNFPTGLGVSFTNDSQKIIVIALVITSAVAIIELIANPPTDIGPNAPAHAPTVQSILVGVFIAGAILLAMSYFLPEFASGLALVAMTATVFERGKPFWLTVSSLTTPAPVAPAAPPASTNPNHINSKAQ